MLFTYFYFHYFSKIKKISTFFKLFCTIISWFPTFKNF